MFRILLEMVSKYRDREELEGPAVQSRYSEPWERQSGHMRECSNPAHHTLWGINNVI